MTTRGCPSIASASSTRIRTCSSATPATDATFAGNEDETEFGLHNYLGLAVHDSDGTVVGTVCVLDASPRDYTDEQRAELDRLRFEVEKIVRQDGAALG